MSVPGPDREPPVGLGGRGREARVDGDELRAAREAGGELGDLRGEDVLAQVAADQDDELRFLEVERLGRAEGAAEREHVPDVARPAALREGRLDAVRGAVGLEQRAHEAGADAVGEEPHRLGPVLLLDRLQLVGEEVEGLVPRDALELPLAPLAGAQHRVLQPVGVVEESRARVAPRAQAPLRQRVVGVALDAQDAAVRGDVRDHAAAPEAHLAEASRSSGRAAHPCARGDGRGPPSRWLPPRPRCRWRPPFPGSAVSKRCHSSCTPWDGVRS